MKLVLNAIIPLFIAIYPGLAHAQVTLDDAESALITAQTGQSCAETVCTNVSNNIPNVTSAMVDFVNSKYPTFVDNLSLDQQDQYINANAQISAQFGTSLYGVEISGNLIDRGNQYLALGDSIINQGNQSLTTAQQQYQYAQMIASMGMTPDQSLLQSIIDNSNTAVTYYTQADDAYSKARTCRQLLADSYTIMYNIYLAATN